MTAPRLSAGGVIGGKYTVRSILGNGGAVVTYHAVSPQGQEVAVKLYDPAVASHTTVMKSLEQAYAATNALPTNSAAPIIDAGYDQPTLAPFSVTELLRLPSLAGQQRRLAPEEVVMLLKGLARSLDLAHVRNVVHGAIKPTNVFVGPSSNPVIVTDFAANLAKASVPTQEGFVSSAPWIAPEQAQSGSITPAADVFSAGLLCFFALCGRGYWRSCQGQSFDLAGWQEELRTARTPASARAAELGVPLSPTLDMVIWKAISNDPAERYKSIGEFASVMEDSMRAQVGSAATMALPMVGDAPSPLPADMRNPERDPPRPNANPNLTSGATLALSVDQLTGGYIPGQNPQAPMQQGGMMGTPGGYAGAQMSQQGMMAVQAQQGVPPQALQSMSGMQVPYDARMSGQGMPAVGMQQPAGSYGGYAGARDQGYPPPPGPNGMLTNIGSPPPPKSSKAVPIVIGFTAVALLGTAGTVLALKWKDLNPSNAGGPVAVAASASAAPTTEPTPTAPATQTAAPTPTPTTSSSAGAPAAVAVKIVCQPGPCDEVKVDGNVVDAKALADLKLAPGKHPVDVSRSGYVAQSGDIEVKEGSAPVTKTFTLQKEAAAAPENTGSKNPGPGPTGTGTGGGKKPPCKKGGFIKCK